MAAAAWTIIPISALEEAKTRYEGIPDCCTIFEYTLLFRCKVVARSFQISKTNRASEMDFIGYMFQNAIQLFTCSFTAVTPQAEVIDEDADISCGYPIDQFLTGAIINSYLLLMVFAWSFLGFETHFSIGGRKRRFLRPFSSLSFVALLYFVLFVLSMIM